MNNKQICRLCDMVREKYGKERYYFSWEEIVSVMGQETARWALQWEWIQGPYASGDYRIWEDVYDEQGR